MIGNYNNLCSTMHNIVDTLIPGEPVKEATPSADTLWNVLKRQKDRKMQTVEEYSQYMRVYICMCIDSHSLKFRIVLSFISNLPTQPRDACCKPMISRLTKAKRYYNAFTLNIAQHITLYLFSKVVPLTQLLRQEVQQASATQQTRAFSNLLNLEARQNEMRANALLKHKQVQNGALFYHPSPSLQLLAPLEREAISRTTQIQKRHSSPPVSVSLSSTDKRSHTPTEDQAKVQPVFLTESSQPFTGEPFTKIRGSRWLPLSCVAVEEHERTTIMPVKLFSHLGHGKYSMWKPLSSLTRAN